MSSIKLKELMKSQDVSSASPLNRALKLNEQLQAMREKNVNLYDQNQELIAKSKDLMGERTGLVQLVNDLNTELDDLRITSVAKERRLTGELRNMQASWDSLYEEHRAAEERRERERRAMNQGGNQEDKMNQQAAPSEMVSPMEQKLHEMENENKQLKSKVVQLQTKYKEEKYKNEHGDRELDSTSITDSESGSSAEKPVTGVRMIAGFAKRNQGRRQNTTPKFGQSTKNLWGRMTNTKIPKQHNEFEFSTINLAFSRDD
jgi:DNA repair exonuclease SbcCD ATPase subunit